MASNANVMQGHVGLSQVMQTVMQGHVGLMPNRWQYLNPVVQRASYFRLYITLNECVYVPSFKH